MRRHSTFWVLLACLIPLLGWWTYGLFDLDEGFYAAVTSEMNRRGEWVTPLYNGWPWFEKPILLYWLAKPCLALFGPVFGPRLPDVLATFSCSALCLWCCRRHFSDRVAIFSTLIFASTPLVVALGRMMMTDPILLLCMSAAFVTFYESLVGNPRWRILSAIALGFGILAKGPVAGILFIPPVAWVFARYPETRPQFKGGWLLGTLCLIGVTACWYLPAYLVDGNVFIQKFLVDQNLRRFSGGGDEAHTVEFLKGGAVYYVVIFLLAFLPWSLWFPTAWKRAEHNVLNGFLKAWFLTVLIFFTLTKAKLPHYILPLSMPCAILIGQQFAAGIRGTNRAYAWPAAALAFVTIFSNLVFYGYYHGMTVGPVVVPGFHAEVHAVARYVHDHANPIERVVEYKIGRQQKSLGTGHLKIQETKQPSALLYLDRNTLETDDWNAIVNLPGRVWIITRADRITDTERQTAGGRLVEVPVQGAHEFFRLYLLEPVNLKKT